MLGLRAGALFDGHARMTGADTVLIDGGRIAGVTAGPPDGVDVVDLGDGVTLLPGLIDPHLHLCLDASMDIVAAIQNASAGELYEQTRRAAATALAAGITTIRDLGDRGYLTLRLRDALAKDYTAGPEILAAGPPITTARGHCWFLGGEVADPADVRAAVVEHAERDQRAAGGRGGVPRRGAGRRRVQPATRTDHGRVARPGVEAGPGGLFAPAPDGVRILSARTTNGAARLPVRRTDEPDTLRARNTLLGRRQQPGHGRHHRVLRRRPRLGEPDRHRAGGRRLHHVQQGREGGRRGRAGPG